MGRPAESQAGGSLLWQGLRAFVGRVQELSLLESCCARARSGEASVALVTGKAGIGKTTLLQRLLVGQPDFSVLTANGNPADPEKPFDVLSQLLSGVPGSVTGAYPLLQRLDARLAPMEVGAEFIGLLGALTDSGPIAVTVDDLQWMDPSSANVIGYALRRLWAERIVVLLLTRAETAVAQGGRNAVPEWGRLVSSLQRGQVITLTGFDADEIIQLGEALGVGRVSQSTATRLQRQTAGNALFLRTVLSEWTGEEDAAAPQPLIPGSLAVAVRRQAATLPSDSIALLEALAVLDTRCPLALAAAVAGISDPAAALQPLLQAGLVHWSPMEAVTPVWIRHALQREAIYEMLSPTGRRALHAAAVPVVDQEAAWHHRVAAASGPDPELVAELDHEAEQALARGRPTNAAGYLLWAADLSENRIDREQRTLTAAAHLLWNYGFARASRLHEAVERCAPSPLRSCVLGRFAMMDGLFRLAYRHFEETTSELAGSAGRTATTGAAGAEADWVAALAATGLASLNLWQGSGPETVEAARLALRQRGMPPQVHRLALQFDACGVLHTSGARAALRRSEVLLEIPDDPRQATPELVDSLSWRAYFRVLAGELTSAVQDATAALQLGRGSAVEVDVDPHYCLALAQYLLGAWDDAAINAEHAISAVLLEQKTWAYAHTHAVASLIAAGRGMFSKAAELVQEAQHWTTVYGPAQYAVYPAIAAGTLAQAQGDYQAMLDALGVFIKLDTGHGWPFALQPLWLPLYIEALLGTGRHAEAEVLLQKLRDLSEQAPDLRNSLAWLTGMLARAQDRPQDARAVYASALAAPQLPDDMPLVRAQLERDYGLVLADLQDHQAAVEWLGHAQARFTALGARPFAARCAEHLTRLGRSSPERSPAEHGRRLTDRERAVAVLVGRGMSNADVARKLYISSKTVEYHLSNIYAKLRITSRKELQAAGVDQLQES